MKKSKRLALMMKHKELVKAGKYDIAYSILRLLVKHEIVLGLSESHFKAELVMYQIGCKIKHINNYSYAVVFDFAE